MNLRTMDRGALDKVRPEQPLEWDSATIILATVGYESTRETITTTRAVAYAILETRWGNVRRAIATEDGSSFRKTVGYGGGIAFYLVGAGLIANELNNWKTGQPVSKAAISAGAAVALLGVPLFVRGAKNGGKTVTVYGEGKGKDDQDYDEP